MLPPKVAFLGPEGTYSHQAAFNRFGVEVEYVQKDSIADTFAAIPSEALIAVVPAENSIFGSVVETLDLLRLPEIGKEKLIVGQVVLQIQHCLLAARGVQLSDIKNVLSHEQALGQCSNFLKRHVPDATLTRTPSTAAAAEAILAVDARQNSAAICSEICLNSCTDLVLLEKGIQNEDNNFTRFWIVVDSSLPLTLGPKCNALLRISPPSEQLCDLSSLVTQLNLPVIHIDRRPSTQITPFLDVYFLHVSQRPLETHGGIPNGSFSWELQVNVALDKVRALGWQADALGFW